VRKILVAAAAALALLGLGGAAQAAHDEPHGGSDAASTAYVHGHTYDCGPMGTYKYVCIDPTTGFGPLIYFFNGQTLEYATGVTGACGYVGGTTDGEIYWPHYDSSSYVQAVAFGTSVYWTNGVITSCGGQTQAVAWMPQSTLDTFRYVTNQYPWSFAIWRH
jgi:hypothetical protein